MKTNLLNDLSNVLKKGTSLSEKGTSLNLLPKMDREWIGNDSRMDRQSLGKIFRYAAVLFMLFMVGIGQAWGASPLTVETPDAPYYTQDGVTVFGENTTGKMKNSSSQKCYNTNNASVIVFSELTNITGISFDMCLAGDGSGEGNAISLYTSTGGVFAVPSSGFTATKGGSALGSLTNIQAIKANQSSLTSISVTFDSPVKGIELKKAASTNIRNIVVTYNNTTLPSVYFKATTTSTADVANVETTPSGGSMTVDTKTNKKTINSIDYYQAESGSQTINLGTGNTFQAGDQIVLEFCGSGNNKTVGPIIQKTTNCTISVTVNDKVPAKVAYIVSAGDGIQGQTSATIIRTSSDLYIRSFSVLRAAAVGCPYYSFHTGGNDVKENNTQSCFVNYTSTEEWQLRDYTIPADTKFFVGERGYWYNSDLGNNHSRSSAQTWASEMYLAKSFDSEDAAGSPKLGQATGATGTIRIYDNSNWNNLNAAFIPDGYVLKVGSNEHAFAFLSSNEYRTDIVEINSTTYDDAISVGVKNSSNGYVATANSQELRHIFFVPSPQWKSGNAKFCIHYWGAGDSRIGFMSEVPGKSGWYEGWLPSGATGFQFERQNPAGSVPSSDNRWTAGDNQTLQDGKNCYTMTATGESWDGTITTSLYSASGKYRIWDNSKSINWYVTFVPHYVLRYDANGGSNAPNQQSIETTASPCQLTVAAGSGMTAPIGYQFLGWNPNESQADAGTKDGSYDPDDTPTMSEDVTLYAVWSPKEYTITLNGNGGSGHTGSVTATYNSATLASITNPSLDCYTFDGWYSGEGGTGTLIINTSGALQASTTYTGAGGIWTNDGAVTLYAKWTKTPTALAVNLGGDPATPAGGSPIGTEYTLTCSASTGVIANYQWKQNTTASTAGAVNAEGTGATTASFNPVPAAAGTYYYYCVATDACGNSVNTSFSGVFQFNAAAYTVTYNKNGDGAGGAGSVTGTLPTDATDYSSGDRPVVKMPGDLALADKTFIGWNDAANGSGTYYSPGANFAITANKTLYAQWRTASSCPGGEGGTVFSLTMGDNSSGSATTMTPGLSVKLSSLSYATITKGEASFTNTHTSSNKGSITKANPAALYLGGAASTIILYLDCALRKDDQISFTGVNDKEICFSSTTYTRSETLYTTSQAYTIPSGSPLIGSRILYIWRKGGDSFGVTGITITRPASVAATITATKTSPDYVTTDPNNLVLSISTTGASSGWYYRVKKVDGGYQDPDNTPYNTSTWTMTSGLTLGANNFVVELYNGSGEKQAESATITVTAETAYSMTIAAGAGGSASPASTWANGDHLHPEITATPASGYHFVNWTKNNENATLANASSATTTITNASGACTITANFEADATLYTVTFNSNGGSAVSPITQASEDASIAKPSDPTRTSYEFDGWYATAGEKISWPYTPEADITLYARWQEACDAGSGEEGATKIIGFTTATCSKNASTGGERTLSNVSNLTVAHEIHDGGDGDDTLIVYTSADQTMYYGSTTKVYSRGGYRWIKGNPTLGNNTVGFSATVASGYQFTIDSISFGIGGTANFTYQVIIYQSDTLYKSPIRSVTNYSANTSANHEFHVNGLSAQTKLQNLTGTFYVRVRVCQSSTGKYFYLPVFQVIGNLHESGGGGGGIGTCYHVYYKGNGADEGFVADTTSYADGEEVTVLDYDDSRYPLAKDGYEFRGWATSAGGSVAYSAGDKITIDGADVALHAVWVAESDALVTWTMNTNTETWGASATSTTDGTNITSIGTTRTGGGTGSYTGATAKVTMATAEVTGSAAPSNSANFTFTIGATKQVEISKFDCQVFNVSSGNRTYKAQISDAAGNVYNSTNKVAVSAEATLTDASFVFGSTKILRGAVTIRVYAWGSGSEFRMGPDVKFYGAVQDYACATPSAPTISGVSEYVPGQTITLTASHEGENYDNLTTYTWYKGDTWGSKSKVQNAATGSAGYTFTKASCAAGDAGKYWCEVANGTCNAHNSEGYNIIVYPTYTITYNLNGGTNPVDPAPKTTYTQMDEDYTLPVPTKADAIFAGWYGASDFSGLPTVVLGAGSVGNKEYWAKWGETVTVSWTVTKVDDKLYRGGGGYSVKAVIDQTEWSDSYKDQLELTATEGVTLKNIVASVVSSHVQVTADFDITTDLAADATSFTFTLNVPADGTYGPKVDEHEEDLTDCGGGASGYTEFFSMIPKANTCSITNTEAYNASNHYTTCECTSSATITSGGSVTYGLYSSGTGTTSKYWEYNGGNGGWKHSTANSWVVLYSTDQFKAGDSIVITNGNSSNSGYYTIVASASNNTADYHSVSRVAAPSTTTPAKNTNYYYKLPASFVSSNYLVIRSSTSSACYVGTIKAYHAGASGGITPTLTWDDGDADIANDGVSKSTSNDDFVYTARQDKNSLGAITYSSSDATVATVNATTGQVHLVGAAGSATITATIAASGCYESASVSYTITVTDDCDDEAGTIATEDLGCSGVKMTVTGHTAAAGVSYQWYKVGTPSDTPVGTNQDNFTTAEAGSYYVIVTNTGDRHCAKRSTNTVTVEAQAAATVTKIVDSWYVKKDRRTPDIELVKTTNATSFTVTSGSITIWESAGSIKTGFAGCGFHMGENGIIYLNGTKDNGDAPAHDDGTWAAGDETLTITAIGCGGNASQNITIHKQAATNYKEIAFVADGGKGMRKDSITVGHGDGTELYEYLDSVGTAAGKRLFQLSERNIYWTTDEKAIREEYSRFDAILITDDPSTNTVVKTGDDYKTKGYVNAFGTMVDVRPIFTMEAYVSALKNWGSKGIAGNPQSPNPRQYEMRLECKDHEIYGAGLPDPDDGTNVWEEVIDGETFRHVILVDSTKGVYKGVAYNAETAGNQKPALQGFTGEAAGSLLGLGRILEGTLQAAIERQEEPAARLLVMGINAKALQPTCALTNEGKTVIKNILVYLLKTNMEEVDDCSNYFTGKNSSDWNNASNWSKNQLPSSEAKVRILAPCVISGVQPHVAQVAIVSSGKSSIRETATGLANCNGKLTINADGALIVGGKVSAAEAPHFAANDLKPTTVNNLIINTDEYNQAALIFDNDEGKTQATVNLYSLGRKVSETNQFQYFAIPMSYLSVNPTFANETHGITIYTYVWLEATGWERRGYYTDLYAFEGIGITTDKTTAHEYTMKGTLASTKDQEIPITADGKKLNLIGNSWTAPIQISELEASDFGDASSAVEQTVYIYCAGHGKSTADGKTEAAGQWLAIPFEATRFDAWDGLKVIPSMQAFQIKTKGEGTLTLDYDKHVRGGSTDLTAKLRAPQRRAAHDGVELMRIRVADSKTHTDLYLFEGDQFSDAFDNGWEANYRVGTNESAKLYARVATGVMSVAAMSDLEGTPIYFIPGQETEYTFTFGGNGMGYYLNDLKLQQSTLISEGAEYSFTYEKGDAAARFMISATPYESPQVTTGTENVQTEDKPRKILYNNKLYIIYNGHVYSADGAIVK